MHSPRISVDVHFMKKNIYVQKIKRLISLNTHHNIIILINLKTQSIIKGISARFYPHAISTPTVLQMSNGYTYHKAVYGKINLYVCEVR